MKKAILIFCLLALLVPANVLARSNIMEFPCTSSTEQTGSALLLTGTGVFYGILVMTDGTNAVTVDIYDNTSAAGTAKFIPTWVVPTSATDRAKSAWIAPGHSITTGIYVNITCSGTVKYKVYYEAY